MTGLEPHPIFTWPPPADKLLRLERAVGREEAARRLDLLRQERAQKMELEREDPFTHGYEPAIWALIDDMLCEGKRVCLIDHPEILPKDFTRSQSDQLELIGRRDILLHGANGASKSEYAGKKVMKILRAIAAARTWCFHETGPESVSRQQPLLFKYLPNHIRRAVEQGGRYKRGHIANVSYSQKNGFTEATFVLDNASQNWFKNYAQEETTVEGEQLDAAWLDELAPITLVKTVKFRLVRRKGLFILTFTPIKGWTATVQEYNQGAKTILEVEAELLPIKDADNKPTGKLQKVPRIKIAGPGTEGSLKANVVYLHSSDNPFFDKVELFNILRGAREQLIKERAYGVATKAYANQFPKFNPQIHEVVPDKIPRMGTNYHIVDPCEGRNWFMLWIRIAPNPIRRPDGSMAYKRFVYREWPSTDHSGLTAYIPGVGDPGVWSLPGNKADGDRGPAQDPIGWGLDRYKTEIMRVEGKLSQDPGKTGEVIMERLMDSRAAAAPTQTNAEVTTLSMQMAEIGMYFIPASGNSIGEGVGLINDGLDYDDEVAIGKYSPQLARINEPLLYVSSECPNLLYSLREWTGKDGLRGACKDPIDVLRYAFEANLQFVGAEGFKWKGGGSY